MAIEAIRRAGVKDREAILQACLAIKDFDKGRSGTWSFDANGDTTLRTISGNVVRNGTLRVRQSSWASRRPDRHDVCMMTGPPASAAGSSPLTMLPLLLAQAESPEFWQTFCQYALIGLTNGALFALIALGYTMVYGIIELINFAHGDVFMLGAFLALALIGWLGLEEAEAAHALAGHRAVVRRRAGLLRRAQRLDRPAGLQAAAPCAEARARWFRPSACRSC